MFTTARNAIAKAKIIKSKHKGLYKVVCAFNVYETTKQFKKTVWKFPVQAKCEFVSGDVTLADLAGVLDTAKKVLRTDNIQIV